MFKRFPSSTCLRSCTSSPDPSQRISVSTSIRYLGHILRHFDSLEHKKSFNTSHSLRTISSPFRIGRPRVHWPEIVMSEACHRYLQLHNGHSPSNQEVHRPLYEIATTAKFNATLALP